MKLFLLTLTLIAMFTAATDKHYHYHFENLPQHLKEEARKLVMEAQAKKHQGIKNWGCKTWCFMKNMFNTEKRNECYGVCDQEEAARNNESKVVVQTNVQTQVHPPTKTGILAR